MICSCHFCQKLCVHGPRFFGSEKLSCNDCGVTYEMSYLTLSKMIFRCTLNQKEFSLELRMTENKMDLVTPTGRLYFDFLPTDITPQNVTKKIKTFLVFS
jgi:hypothetical protein